jgi:hypothetical protein
MGFRMVIFSVDGQQKIEADQSQCEPYDCPTKATKASVDG